MEALIGALGTACMRATAGQGGNEGSEPMGALGISGSSNGKTTRGAEH
jgi:hypothetical protein